MIVTDERVAAFISDKLGHAFCPPFIAIGTESNGAIVNAVLFNHFEGADVHVSIAGTGWTRALIRAVGIYVYDTLRCERMTVITGDAKVAEYAQRLGGVIEGNLRNHFGVGRDGVLLGILREDWAFRQHS